jgi:hypothetical protein
MLSTASKEAMNPINVQIRVRALYKKAEKKLSTRPWTPADALGLYRKASATTQTSHHPAVRRAESLEHRDNRIRSVGCFISLLRKRAAIQGKPVL